MFFFSKPSSSFLDYKCIGTFGLGPHNGNKFLFTLQGYQCSGLSVRGRMRKTFISITIRAGMRKIISSFILKSCTDSKKKLHIAVRVMWMTICL